ncbi:hypothetical protein LJC26_06510 [Desulfovibrio sp. OttesenSCG-928-O18]|nr:hypothetical protein [Desulfovibrio sp. OttesenSCG-928-O18]
MRKYTVTLLLVFTVVLGGCLGSESENNSDPVSAGLNYYYDEFQDVAIPREMTPEKKETFITYGSDGMKLGTQMVAGRVEMASLVSAMQGHMQRDGWALRSIFRSSRSILIFEKPERMCSMYISDGVIDTSMLIFVSPKLADGALQYSVPVSTSTEPLVSGDPPLTTSGGTAAKSNGNVTVYPAK